MKWAVTAVVLVVAASACTSTERETLLTTDGVPVTAAVSNERACLEIGEGGDQGGWCAPGDQPSAVWLGATSVGDRLVVAGQAPAEVVSVTLTREGDSTELAVVQSEFGPFFVGTHVPPGDYEVSAATADGTEYVSGQVSMSTDGTMSAMLTP